MIIIGLIPPVVKGVLIYASGFITYPILLKVYYYFSFKIYYKRVIRKSILKCDYKKFRNALSTVKKIDNREVSHNYYNEILDLYNIDENIVNNEQLFNEQFNPEHLINSDLPKSKIQNEILKNYINNLIN
jgi:hypothetical protein